MISGSNEQLQQEMEYTLLKPDCHSRRISKMQYWCEEKRYSMKFCFKQGKHSTEIYGKLLTAFGPSCMNRVSRDERSWDEGHWHAHTKGLPWGLCRSCWNGTSALKPERITSKGSRFYARTINKSAHTKKKVFHPPNCLITTASELRE